MSPGKVPLYADMLFKGNEDDSLENANSGFKFNLQSIFSEPPVTAWKADLIGQIDSFEQNFATRKADIFSKFYDNMHQSLKSDKPNLQSNEGKTSFCSPGKPTNAAP